MSSNLPLKEGLSKNSIYVEQRNDELISERAQLIQTEENKVLFYQKNINEDISNLKEYTRNLILSQQTGILWSEQFAETIAVVTLDFNNQSVKILLHYGNFKMIVTAILTDFDSKILNSQIYDNGSFGSIYDIEEQEQVIIVKGINYVNIEGKLPTSAIYREYFMARIGSCLRVGPKLKYLFGYDLVFFRGQACFAMQKCSESFIDLSKTEKNLVQNLKIMHSIGFMHLDIKPDNTAYSQVFKRFVFIDFGFSKIIKEPFKRKTWSLFYGTLQYCSVQMKEIYYSGFPGYVDLYFNDLVSLLNSFSKKKKYFNINKRLAQHLKVNKSSESKKKPVDSMVMSIIQLLRLKFYIWNENIFQILDLINASKNIQFTSYYILLSDYVPQHIQQNDLIRQLIVSLKQKINGKMVGISNEDRFFLQTFHSKSSLFLTPTSLSIQHVLSLPQEKFQQFGENVEWVQKFFSLLNPISNYFPRSTSQSVISQAYRERLKVIDKIYFHALRKHKCKPSKIQSYRSWIATKFIYQKLKPLGNRDLFISIRLLFLMTTDLQKIQEISEIIIDCTQNAYIKMLTIVEYQLFLDIGLKYLEPVNPKYIDYVLGFKEQQNQQLRLIKKLTLQVLNRQRKYYETLCKDRIISILDQVDNRGLYSQNIRIIRFLYTYLSRDCPISEKKQKLSIQQQSTKSVYSIYFDTFTNKHLKKAQFYYFSQIYRPMAIQDELFENQMNLQSTLEEMFQIKKQMGKSWITFIDHQFDECISQTPKILLLVLRYCRILIPCARISRINTYYMFRNIFWLIDLYAKFAHTSKARQNFHQETRRIALHKIYDIFTSVTSLLTWNEECWYKVAVKSLESTLSILRGFQMDGIEEVAKQIYKFAKQVKQMDWYIILYFLSFFICFEDKILAEKKEHFIQKYI